MEWMAFQVEGVPFRIIWQMVYFKKRNFQGVQCLAICPLVLNKT